MTSQNPQDKPESQPALAASACSAWNAGSHLDLFSGIGGFALAARWSGWKTIGFAETDEYASKVLRKHWPDVPNFGDVRNVRGVRADLITGGFPCQPYSLAGKRRGATDDRALWPEMRRIIEDSRPAWVLAENVPGIIGMELDTVLADLDRLDYACWPLVIPACAVDARHRRERVWIVANATRFAERKPADETVPKPTGRRTRDEPGNRCELLANASSARLAQRKEQSARQEFEAAQRNGGDVSNSGRGGSEGQRPSQRGREEPSWWLAEPELGRVANGIPCRVDRLRGLGNAVVPGVAAVLLRMMAQTPNDQDQPRQS